MKYNNLGTTDIKVSEICLGTMTWGTQNTEEEAHEQLDYALSHGINFIDTAEFYPVTPPSAETQGSTERYIGTWIASRKNRDQFYLASKVIGRSENTYIRGEEARLSKKHIIAALEGSLERLQTDYLDLYQLHWPERKTNYFGKLGYEHEPREDDIELEETLGVLADLQKEGKIRHVGVSNESPWGLMHALELHKRKGLPRVESIQNTYHLANRMSEIGISEVVLRERVSFLAYSPLAMGVLTGKYLGGAKPEGARFSLMERNSARYNPERVQEAVRAYVALAKEFELDPAVMAIAFAISRDFITSTIIGATTMEQLKTAISAADVKLSPELLERINAIHHRAPNLAW